MIRNKTPILLKMKQLQRGTNKIYKQDDLLFYESWVEQVYQQKELLTSISQTNKIVRDLVREYEMAPSVFQLQKIEKQINSNCQLINQMDSWLSQGSSQAQPSKARKQTQANIRKHFNNWLGEEIRKVFEYKQRLIVVNNEIEHHRSFSLSYSRIQNPDQGTQRERIFNEVNYKIENLNTILRRMNNLVKDQGQLVNRIDEYLLDSEDKMKKAAHQLKQRAEREEGGGEFSFEGKVNQVITSLYLVNLGLIAVFLIKNTIF